MTKNQLGQGLKILTLNQILSRLPIYWDQLKVGNNSEKLINEIRQLLHSLYRSKNLLKQSIIIFDQYHLKMESILINTENSKTNKPHRFRLSLADKLTLKDRKKNMTLVNLSIYYTLKNINNIHIITINLKYLLQLGMMNLICLMDHILFHTFKIILNIILKNLKLK